MTSSMSYGKTSVLEHSLTSQELEQGRLYLQQTRSGIIGAIKGMSDAQWRFSPGPEYWTISEVVEHINFVLERVAGPVQEALAEAPPPPPDRDYTLIDAIVIHQFPTRLNKFPAPPFSHPTGRFESPAGALGAVMKSYAALLDCLESATGLREHALEAPPLKAVTKGVYALMDGYQWILASAAHAERHTKQILEIKADENFPAN